MLGLLFPVGHPKLKKVTEQSKQYDPKAHETTVYQKWEVSGAFQPNQKALKAGKKPFVIMLPLPNVTGNLHMGHALQHTMMDAAIRYHRMKDEPTLWQPGTDHAGISTQNVVEKQLRKEGISRHDLGREEFLKRVWQWKEKSGGEILRQMRRLGASCDWQRDVFTMDPRYVRAVHEAFLQYYQHGYIYRGKRIVNWCPRCASVISDLETEYEDRSTQLITLCYPLADNSGHIDVATTRPETMLGDTAVAVHPTDDRYRSLVGKNVRLPLTGRQVPIIADERIDKNFGTGAVKVTPAHDPLDAQLAETHHLPAINIISEDGKLTSSAGEFAGLGVGEARRRVLETLRAKNVVQKEEEYAHKVMLCARCGTVIESLLSRQWFVDMGKLKKETITVAEKELVKFLPPRWEKHFLHWMHNVHDWTISRQLWWGHQIPVWWEKGKRGTDQEEGSFIVSREKPAGDYEQDPDVLDTWFSSALWPFATLGWPEATEDLKTFYPTSVLITGRDILYLWVARMIFSGLEFMKGKDYGSRPQSRRIPFREVLINPTVLNKQGQRMSKSLGTGVDPLELIEKYGADATRFGLMYQMSYDSQAIKFDEDAIKSARNFANKIWNIGRFLESLTDSPASIGEAGSPGVAAGSVADRWIESRFSQIAAEVTQLLKTYKFGEAARLLYEFVWKDFADWYVEILKVEGNATHAQHLFQQTLILLHPFMPHLTEVLWRGDKMLIFGPWFTPSKVEGPTLRQAQSASESMERFQSLVTTIRSARTLLALPPSEKISVHIKRPPLPKALPSLTNSQLSPRQGRSMKAFPTVQGESVYLTSPSLNDTAVEAARVRLTQQQEKLASLISQQGEILAHMRGRAPADKVAEKENLTAEAQKRLAEVTHSLKLLQS